MAGTVKLEFTFPIPLAMYKSLIEAGMMPRDNAIFRVKYRANPCLTPVSKADTSAR